MNLHFQISNGEQFFRMQSLEADNICNAKSVAWSAGSDDRNTWQVINEHHLQLTDIT